MPQVSHDVTHVGITLPHVTHNVLREGKKVEKPPLKLECVGAQNAWAQFFLYTSFALSPADENVAPGHLRSMNVIEVSDNSADQLNKSGSGDQLSVSEKILIESSSERDRISELKVRVLAFF